MANTKYSKSPHVYQRIPRSSNAYDIIAAVVDWLASLLTEGAHRKVSGATYLQGMPHP
jgi:hypothetical protein